MTRPPAQRSDSPPLPAAVPGPDLTGLTLPELRTLRRDAQRDEADLSYVRRLLQGRIDILRAELARRCPEPTEPTGPTEPTAAPGPAASAARAATRETAGTVHRSSTASRRS
jgi:anti-sigma-K factor RsiG